MGKKKGTKRPAPRPRPKPIYRSWSVAGMVLGAALAVWALQGCGDEVVDDAATCTVLGALVAENLIIDRGCPVEPSFAVDFVAACGSQRPTEEQALACLTAVYELDECPETLPGECLLFAAGVLVTP